MAKESPFFLRRSFPAACIRVWLGPQEKLNRDFFFDDTISLTVELFHFPHSDVLLVFFSLSTTSSGASKLVLVLMFVSLDACQCTDWNFP